MYTKNEILLIAKTQLALDYNCRLTDFETGKNTIVKNNLIDGRRIYNSDGCFLKLLCFGNSAIISTSPTIMPWCEEKLLNRDAAWIFEYSKLCVIDKELQKYGHEIADVHHYYLPNSNVSSIEAITSVNWYEYEDILQFKNDDRFGEAFAFDENHPDVLAVAALDGNKIMGMAGASEDSKTMWQIGINVLPSYRGRGIGTNLVELLKNEILKRGKIPFYGTVESHLYSQNIAVSAGFFPAWAELYSKPRMKKGLSHCIQIFPVSDINRTTKYYEHLGFKAVYYLESAEPHVCLYRDSTEVILIKSKNDFIIPNREGHGYGYDAYFVAENQMELQEEFINLGVKIIRPLSTTDYNNNEFVFEDIDTRWIAIGKKIQG